MQGNNWVAVISHFPVSFSLSFKTNKCTKQMIDLRGCRSQKADKVES